MSVYQIILESRANVGKVREAASFQEPCQNGKLDLQISRFNLLKFLPLFLRTRLKNRVTVRTSLPRMKITIQPRICTIRMRAGIIKISLHFVIKHTLIQSYV